MDRNKNRDRNRNRNNNRRNNKWKPNNVFLSLIISIYYLLFINIIIIITIEHG